MNATLPFGRFAAHFVLASALALAIPCRAQTPPPPVERSQGPDETVRMEAFNVDTTTLGRYTEDTSSMAAKVPTAIKDIAGSLTIINNNSLGDHRALTLDDIYPYVVGLTRTNNNGQGWSIRGFTNVGTGTPNTEVDGLPGMVSSKGAVSAADIEEVEFLKGPQSVLYGLLEPDGVQNVVTKSPKAIRETSFSEYFSTFAGTFSKFGDAPNYIGVIDTTGPIDQGKHLLYRLIVHGQDLKPFRKGDYEKHLYIYPSLTYRWSPETWLSVKVEYANLKWRADDGLWTVFNSVGNDLPYLSTVYQEPTDVDRDWGESVSEAFQTRIGSRWTYRASARTVWHAETRNTLVNAGAAYVSRIPIGNSTIARAYLHRKFGHRYNYFDTNTYGVVGPAYFENTLLLGIGGGYEFLDLNRFSNGSKVAPITLANPLLGVAVHPPDGVGVNDPKTTTTNLGFYFSDQMKIAERFHLNGAVRRDQSAADSFDPTQRLYFAQVVKATVFQAGAVIDITGDLSAYASWGQSFKPQTLTSVDATGRSIFDPQRGSQEEAGLKFVTPDHRLQSTLAVFQLKKTNVLSSLVGQLTPNGTQIVRVDGEQKSVGIEVEEEWLPVPYWQFQAGVSLLKATISQSVASPASVGRDLIQAPRASGNFWTRYNVPYGPLKGLGIGVGVSYNGKRWSGDPTNLAAYFVLPGYTRVDASLYYHWRNCDFALNAQNVLDRKFINNAQNNTNVNPGDPRKLTISATEHF